MHVNWLVTEEGGYVIEMGTMYCLTQRLDERGTGRGTPCKLQDWMEDHFCFVSFLLPHLSQVVGCGRTCSCHQCCNPLSVNGVHLLLRHRMLLDSIGSEFLTSRRKMQRWPPSKTRICFLIELSVIPRSGEFCWSRRRYVCTCLCVPAFVSFQWSHYFLSGLRFTYFSQHVIHTQKPAWLTGYWVNYMFLKVFVLKYMLLHSHPFSSQFLSPLSNVTTTSWKHWYFFQRWNN